MIKGGVGGMNTQTGLRFEERVNFCDLVNCRDNYTVSDNIIYYLGKPVAISLKKHGLYRFLVENGVDYKTILSKKLLPDDALLVYRENKVYIIEIKFQVIGGSTDEKLQTCDFKIKQYRKLFNPLGYKVEYVYILNDWFRKPEYRDVLNYINSIEGCSYYFEEIPLKKIGLSID